MHFLIQGMFFQNNHWLGLETRPIDGVVTMIYSGLCQYMFAGAMWQDPNHVLGDLTGHMQDSFGNSVLSDIRISESEVTFTKAYDRKEDLIRYTFKRQEGQIWIGEYEGEACGTGVSSCIITKVDSEFFQPDFIMKKLNLTSAHEWPKDD